MKRICVFLPGEKTKIKDEFVGEISKILVGLSFVSEYEGENPYITDDLLSETTGAFFVSLKRKDLLAIVAMAISRKLPIIFFFEEEFNDLSLENRYFLEKFCHHYEAWFCELTSCEDKDSARWFKLQKKILEKLIPEFFI